ncbi:MAG: alkaline phosphatase [Balneola sp.]
MIRTVLIASLLFLFTNNCIAQESNVVEVAPKPTVVNEKLPIVADGPIKNVIFIIGDGTGLVQLTSGQYALVGAEGLLHLQTMPVTGIVKTYSANGLITDSAAGATAYSCGVKTDNGKIAQLPDERHCKTVLELAEEKGLSTGIVATSTITHASPASYAAHVRSRGMQAEIAVDYLDSGLEVILGGGKEFFIPSSQDGSRREDDRNVIEDFENSGYEFVESVTDLKSSDSDKILGLFSLAGIPSEERTPTLAEMSSKAIEVLSQNEKGFFLMIEGSQIDWGGHENDVPYVLREVEDFDAAVKAALDFAKEDGETLVVLTADHETGGMTINSHYDRKDEVEIAWTTTGHTGVPVPLMAYGPHAIEFTGWLENTEVGQKVARLLGVGTLPQIIEE